MARPTGIKSKTYPLRFPEPLLRQIKIAAEALGWSEADVIRMATEIGLVRLKRIDYRIAEIVDSATEKIVPVEDLKAAEDSPEYGKPTPKKHNG